MKINRPLKTLPFESFLLFPESASQISKPEVVIVFNGGMKSILLEF